MTLAMASWAKPGGPGRCQLHVHQRLVTDSVKLALPYDHIPTNPGCPFNHRPGRLLRVSFLSSKMGRKETSQREQPQSRVWHIVTAQ